jgi:hypothetical protein
MFEIGVSSGNSVVLWQRVFDDIEYHGADITFVANLEERIQRVNKEIAGESQSFDIHLADQGDGSSLEGLMQKLAIDPNDEGTQFDIIVDDGSHHSGHHIASINALFSKYLKRGGIYVIEDVASTHFTNIFFTGTPPNVRPDDFSERQAVGVGGRDESSIAKAIGAIESMHADGQPSAKYGNFDLGFAKQIKSVAFYDQVK